MLRTIYIGLYTGATGNLDGYSAFAGNPDIQQILPHNTQLISLDERLSRADRVAGSRAIVLFHLPPLSNDKQGAKHLTMLQQILSSHPCVKLILCGHEHNHQQYPPPVYRRYLVDKKLAEPLNEAACPRYIISGGGGSALHSTAYDEGPYTGIRYPTADDWRKYLAWGTRVVGAAGMDKPLISAIVVFFSKDAKGDADAARYGSFVVLDVPEGGANAEVKPVFPDDAHDLFRHRPDGTVVDMRDEHPDVDPTVVANCFRKELSFTI
jgi:hypothetical protein